MTHSHSLSHSQTCSLIAQEHEMEPSEVEALSKHFGNDFESLDRALDNIEPTDRALNSIGQFDATEDYNY